MRPPRIFILALFLFACLFVVARSLSHSARGGSSTNPARLRTDRSTLWGFAYYNVPFSLFPPNAAISLTDDNSTFFPARPAAFGPKLAAKGLSGQLWVGSGFAEDTLDSDGELGCSDIPANLRAGLKSSFRAAPLVKATKTRVSHRKHAGDALPGSDDIDVDKSKSQPHTAVDDGTDDYLHAGFAAGGSRHDSSTSSSHADIQSIQEAAEIEGKVVLLMRGGCGFLEKVMWAQRRGAVAVIVGDNRKGGPLIQMFAHGEQVDNVTIPSVFTARMTAQLLSSLTRPGSFIEDTLNDNGEPVLKVQQGVKAVKTKTKQEPPRARPAASPKTTPVATKMKRGVPEKDDRATTKTSARRGWVARTLNWGIAPRTVDNKSRPPSSGQRDWVIVEEWDEENDKNLMDSMGKNKKAAKPEAADDDFVIGVQDWRDPDLVEKPGSSINKSKNPDKKTSQKSASDAKLAADEPSSDPHAPKGGSITPGSGEYSTGRASPKSGGESHETESSGSSHGIMSKIFGDHGDEQSGDYEAAELDYYEVESPVASEQPISEPHEGLWVTITPTSSASPFFDTLLVLVISPLVTLTIVYALLILRARIRRRRWRAPKSVVERLPVRTYHTVATTPGSGSRIPSPSSTSPTTPLLQNQAPVRPRPRSRTTTGLPESENLLPASPPIPTPQSLARSAQAEHEKASGSFSAEWRKYMGRQVECVVCLEEYVDGVSRVMSLPCGHEFHADCM